VPAVAAPLFDSHCHLTDARFAEDLDAVLKRAALAGVRGIVTIASNADDAASALALARRSDDLWSTAGVHPHEADKGADSLPRILDLLADPRVVAIGETGLDYHYDNAPRAVQRRVFDEQLAMAETTALPVVVHSREADADMRAAVHGVAGRIRGVLHCFTGSADLLDVALAAGWLVSFGGMVTFRNFSALDLLRQVPADRLLLETDAPYLAPVPHRGRRNEPSYIVHTCEAIAKLRAVEADVLARQTDANARFFFGISA
jgi:TatD DNase family protein